MQGKKGKSRRVALLTAALICVWALCGGLASAAPAPPLIVKAQVTEVSATTATLAARINPEEEETVYQFRFGSSDCSITNCSRIPKTKESIGNGKEPVLVTKALEELEPGTIYHFLVEAESPKGKVKSTDHAFATLGEPSEGLPDSRAYEQASPVNKDGSDAIGTIGLVKAADDGNGITFNSTFGIPGAKGAQTLPTYLAARATGEAGWSTQGLLPPASLGDIAQVQGWLPDFSETFSNATILGEPRVKALITQSTTGANPPRTISPYTFKAEYAYVGTDADNSTVFFESQAKLPPEAGKEPIEAAIAGKSNLYAWDRASGRISLVDVSNLGKAPPGGGFAGPYDWSAGINSFTLTHGGAERGYYLQETNAITAAGDIYFTEAGTGQLYLRRNPTQPQSKMQGEKCLEEEAACTIRVSTSKRTIPDPAGTQPSAFQAATEDGSEVFFTSPQKLTDDANTGPEQPEAAITQANSATGVVEKEKLIPEHAIGVAVDGAHVYWAEPGGSIGRADLDGKSESVDKTFISIPESECEVETKPKVFEKVKAPARPRYVAVTSKYIYWTNAGKLDEEGNPLDGTGTIGRAELDGKSSSIDPDFICGASNPQGIAANATHLYWANAAKSGNRGGIARANIEGEEATEVEEEFFSPSTSLTPFGVALDATYIYVTLDNIGSNAGVVGRVPLEGGPFIRFVVGEAGLRGITIDGTYVYWASQREHTIGRIPIADFGGGNCSEIPTCDKEFASGIAGDLNGLAVNSEHLYWSVNGEASINPGNDLYVFHVEPREVKDLTVDSASPKGADVQGLMGSSPDGSYIYLVANGDLDEGGPATLGDCQTSSAHGGLSTTSGSCNLYVLHEGKARLIGRVSGKDALDWTGSVLGIFASAGSVPKTSFLSKNGQALLFESQAKLTGYENEGVAELYRYSATEETLDCVSCRPSGEAAEKGPSLASFDFPGSVGPPLKGVNAVSSRNLSADGDHAFFETAEALVPGDENGRESIEKTCPAIGSLATPACLDVYEWESPNTPACKPSAPAYSPLNGGCIYLISTGKDKFPSLFADASESGDDVFFFTRQRLVGQDQDELQDVYDARVNGGLAAQNQVKAPPCQSTEACHQPSPPAPAESSPATPGFFGPANPKPVHKKPKAHKQKHKKKHKAKHKRANAKGRTNR